LLGKLSLDILENHLEILLIHLLKWTYQPAHRGIRWKSTIEEQRMRIADHLLESPSLTPLIPGAHTSAYDFAILGAAKDTGLPESTFPATSPWTFEQIMDDTFWPEIA